MNKFKYVSILGWSVVAIPVAMVTLGATMYYVHNNDKPRLLEQKQEALKLENKQVETVVVDTPKEKPNVSFIRKENEAPKNQTVKGRRDTVQSERSDTAAN